MPTGVFVYGAYGHNEYDLLTGDSDTYYVKAGLRERWSALGHTVLYGEYENNQSDQQLALFGTDSEFQLWGVGVVQEIDAAAMSIWVSYRHLDQDTNAAIDFEDFQYVKAGALINF